ncbi:hemerythrin domain-containing protein [Anaeromyxobacter terrae]|uniref:hemerythrin domain-containing protein n=1 Tax=Anaeromyxobacter terrae TaxID=2925406 RepID=UPI001F57608C|nr:hemerythrin domain-containing protein [Anaeromyxobacter sp. SG22]
MRDRDPVRARRLLSWTSSALLVAAAALAAPPRPAAAQHGHEAEAAPPRASAAPFQIPESMRVEHAKIDEELVRATKEPGAVGQAARALAEVLHPHFVREEEIALPPLALLEPLAAGKYDAKMAEVLKLTDALREELPKMLKEHEAIGAAAKKLEATARKAKNAKVEQLAKDLQLHARTEEQVFYPAALLVGDAVRARASR